MKRSHWLSFNLIGALLIFALSLPGQGPSFKTAPQIAAGKFHTVGLTAGGAAVAEGLNGDGRCDVSGWSRITQIVAGDEHTVGLKADGTVVAVGRTSNRRCDVSGWRTIVQVAAGGKHTAGLKADGTAVAAGSNDAGQCNVSRWKGIVQVAAGGERTVGLKADGTVVAVGRNDQGQCDVAGWNGIIQIAAGGSHTVGLRVDGAVVAAGSNNVGQCNVSGWSGIVQVAAGQFITVGLKADGTVVAVGRNNQGQCDVSDWNGITQVAAGDFHTVGLRADGRVVSVGNNAYDQCNIGNWRLADSAPEANDQSVSVSAGTTSVISLAASDADGDTLTFTVVTPPMGTLTGTGQNLTYKARRNTGRDVFTFKASDGFLDSRIATVSINVISEATPPATRASVSPSPNRGGWNDANATVTLTSAAGAAGSGIRSISYMLSGAQIGGGVISGGRGFVIITAEGLTTVSYWGQDTAGNLETSKNLTVKVDKTPPVLTVPANVAVSATGSAGTVVTYLVTAADNIDPSPVVSSRPASGTMFPLGTTTVNCRATDAAGNSSTSSFLVTVVDISLSPVSLTATVGGSEAAGLVTVTAPHGFRAPVTLGVSGVPSGIEAVLDPVVVNADGGTATSTLRMRLAPSIVPSELTLQVTASSGPLTRSAKLTITVVATSQGISDVVGQLFASGAIDDRGTSSSLTYQLSWVQAAINVGNTGTAKELLNTFINHVQGQSGRHISSSAAALLIQDAQALIASLR